MEDLQYIVFKDLAELNKWRRALQQNEKVILDIYSIETHHRTGRRGVHFTLAELG